MMTLDDIRPTPEEVEETARMPEQVAVGFIRAKRKAHLITVKAKQCGKSPMGGELTAELLGGGTDGGD